MTCSNYTVDLELIQTDKKTWKLIFTNPDKTALNLVGYQLFFTVKRNSADLDNDSVLKKTINCPDDQDSQNGIVRIILSSEDTNIPIGNYIYDIKLQQIVDDQIVYRKTVAAGKLKVNTTVTRRTG